jgi:predicted amidohydrolase YtcJ
MRGRAFIEERKPEAGALIVGFGLTEEFWADGNVAIRDVLDKISTFFPIVIQRICGHVLFCNSKALEICGIEEKLGSLGGGVVGLDRNGKPDGVLKEAAANVAREVFLQKRDVPFKDELLAMLKKALSLGITSAATHDVMGPDFEKTRDAYTEILGGGNDAPVSFRIVMQCGDSGSGRYLKEYVGGGFVTGKSFVPDKLKMGSFKLFTDGSLGSRTALLREPYSDDSTTCGVAAMKKETIASVVAKAHAAGFQTAVHAIGDGAMDNVLCAFEALAQKTPAEEFRERRHGIVHCQITDESLLKRMAKLALVGLVQPVFIVDDAPIIESRLGRKRASSSYAWGSMEKMGIRTAYGTDAPFSSLAPLLGLAAAIENSPVRKLMGGAGECVSLATAIDNYTVGSAWANFDTQHGRIAPGFFADMVLLDRNIFLKPDEITKTRVVWTMSDGRLFRW